MTHGSLFSGIGGFDLAARWAGIENKWQVEWDKYCQKVLEKNFPETKKYLDITKLKGDELETVDIISGGFPCQPFSQAGKREGKEDDRYLWPEMLRIISVLKPKYVIGENVAGIINMELDQVLTDLEAEDYTTETFIIPACAVNAPHRRDRVWIVGFSDEFGLQEQRVRQVDGKFKQSSKIVADSDSQRLPLTRYTREIRESETGEQERTTIDRESWWTTEPNVGRVAHGVSSRVDRLKSLGNAIVPQIAYVLFEAIKELEEK